jgi:hypothetical protein
VHFISFYNITITITLAIIPLALGLRTIATMVLFIFSLVDHMFIVIIAVLANTVLITGPLSTITFAVGLDTIGFYAPACLNVWRNDRILTESLTLGKVGLSFLVG